MTTNGLLKHAGRALIFLAAAGQVQGAPTDLATAPLVTSSTSSVLPNVFLMMDDSGSMDWDYMPDINNSPVFSTSKYGYASSQCNGVYFDPAITYVPPVDATGASYPNASFTAAWMDGYKTGRGTLDLSSKFTLGLFNASSPPSSGVPAYYYAYSGSQTTEAQRNFYNSSSTFYTECNTSASTASSVFTKVDVSLASAAVKQNFANWFSYYRTRINMMKTSAGIAFKPIDTHYRVGFATINNNTGSDFLNLATFDSTHKAAWYAKIYATTANNSTPLREALSHVGQMYAGKLTTLNNSTVSDPVQYSCQQNFTLLSTDGFWNGTTTYDLNNKPVGEQDGNEVRPMYDGGVITVTTTTPMTQMVQQTTATPLTTTIKWTETVTTVTGPTTCGGKKNQYSVTTTPQTYTETIKSTETLVQDLTQSFNSVVNVIGGQAQPATTTPPTTTNSVTLSDTTVVNSDTGPGTVSSPWTAGKSSTTCSSTPKSSGTSTPTASSPTTTKGTATITQTVVPGSIQVAGTPTVSSSSSGFTSNTLADVAEYYYKTDLRDSSLSNCSGALGGGVDVCENNVPSTGQDGATWQHMSSFTLGLGARGRMVFSPSYLVNASGDFYSVKNGVTANPPATCSWQTSGPCNWPVPAADQPTAIDDLWHAAVDGRGDYFSATNPTTLALGLQSALASVSAHIGSSAAATTSNPNVTAGDNYVFSSTFTTVDWDGELVRQQLDPATGVLSPTIDWAAQGKLDALTYTSRNIYTFSASTANHLEAFTATNFQNDANFSKSNISTLSQFCSNGPTCLSSTDQTNAAGANLVNFLIGDRSNEGPASDPTKYYRQRAHVLGDIVDAEAVYVKGSLYNYADTGYTAFVTTNDTRQSMVYAAGNDGMLHAFYGADGASGIVGGNEAWAYIPSMVLPNLFRLADKNYSNLHGFYVDGTPTQGDVYFNNGAGSAWHTILVGGLNDGGRGYYALDITNPAAPAALWEFTNANLGYSYGNPVITKLKNGTWVVLVASGYNNESPGDGVGHLFVLDAATGTLLEDINTGVGSSANPSGLARINAWVNDGMHDNTAQRVYGGDLQGNLWRFDINGGTGAHLLATFKDAAGNAQPITAKPELGSVGGSQGIPVVYVGTGRFLGATDLADTSQQSFYAVKDPLDSTSYGNPRANICGTPATNTKSCFVQQFLTSGTCPTGTSAALCTTGQSVRISSNNVVDFTLDDGWFFDFPGSGERDNTDPELAFGTLAFSTNIPLSSACTTGGYSFRYFIDYRTGGAVSTAPTNVVAQTLGNALATRPVIAHLPNNTAIELTRLSDGTTVTSNLPIAPQPGSTRRISWRELHE